MQIDESNGQSSKAASPIIESFDFDSKVICERLLQRRKEDP
jgi:hypothetical protein